MLTSSPNHLKRQVSRELDRLEFTLQQINAVEAERDTLFSAEGQAKSSPAAALKRENCAWPSAVLCSKP
jgi:hypothetical protein